MADKRSEALARKERVRYAVLGAAYDLSAGDESALLGREQLAAECGFDERQVDQACEYFLSEGLLLARAIGGIVSISHDGVVEYERSLREPDRPTEHFALVVNQHFHATVGAVQTGDGVCANVVADGGLEPKRLPADQIRVSEDAIREQSELAGHRAWTDHIREVLREVQREKGGGATGIEVAVADEPHARWAMKHGLLQGMETPKGISVALPVTFTNSGIRGGR